MIKYSLKCDQGHQFDSWFQSASAFEKLKNAGMVTCAVCGAVEVDKAIMTPQISTARKKSAAKPATETAPDVPVSLSEPASPAEQAIAELRRRIESTSEDVGENFAKEARAMHEGQAKERSIIGVAKPYEARELREDGIPVMPLPWSDRKAN